MSQGPTYGFDTLQIHAGARPDPATGARQTPIYQSTAFVFRDADHAAALFNLQEVGYIYSRLTNPTVAVLQERIATLEGGAGAVCCSSGHAAQIMALSRLWNPDATWLFQPGFTAEQSPSLARPFDALGGQHALSILMMLKPLLLQLTTIPERYFASLSPIQADISPILTQLQPWPTKPVCR